jgi:hypothetical protein
LCLQEPEGVLYILFSLVKCIDIHEHSITLAVFMRI